MGKRKRILFAHFLWSFFIDRILQNDCRSKIQLNHVVLPLSLAPAFNSLHHDKAGYVIMAKKDKIPSGI